MDIQKETKSQKRSSIRTKLQLLIVTLIFISTILVAMAAIRSIITSYQTVNKYLEIALENRYQFGIRDQVDTVVSMLETYVNKVPNQKISPSAKEQIKSLVRHAKYDKGEGYFFLFDLNGDVIAHGADPMLEGKNLLHLQDPTGFPIEKMSRSIIQQGDGFVRFFWNKPSDLAGRYKKISYGKLVPHTSWWVGTGIYLDDVDKVISEVRNKQQAILNYLFIQFLVLTIALITLALLMALYFGARISKPIIALSRIAKKISGGNYEVRANIQSNDELGDMAGSFNNMADSINEKIKDLIHKERYTSRLLESIADGLVVTDAENKIIQVNPAVEKILNYKKNELINKNVTMLIPENMREEYKKNVLDQVMQGKTVANYNVKRYSKDGNELSLMITVAPVVEQDKSIRYRIHSIKDMTEQNKLKNQIKQMENLKKYFPTQIAEKLMEADGEINLAHDRRKLTIFFSDLVGFTELSDSMEAEEITSILSEYLTCMSSIVYKYSGTLDKFIGDAIMVFFGAPTTEGIKEDAINCINMALDMQEKLIELNKSWDLLEPLTVRMGINSGYVTVGNFGSEMRLEYTIIGTPVNIASRLENVCTPGKILISHETAQLVKDNFKLHPIEPAHLKGIHRLVQAFEVVERL